MCFNSCEIIKILWFEKIKLLLEEKNIAPHGARAAFICALALTLPNGMTQMAEGRIDGHLCFPPRGDAGFGYDPIFTPNGYSKRFSEMDPLEKNKISHRYLALEKFTAHCFK